MKRNLHILGVMSLLIILSFCSLNGSAQGLRIPDGKNYGAMAGRSVGVTDIEINYNSPGVKGREGKIWGTNVAWYGYQVLGFGSDNPSPWRAGANENTTISFSTDVVINGRKMPAGKYGFFIAVYPDSCTLIFNKNTVAWGSYFYNPALDVMRVKTVQQKDLKESTERLEYNFTNQKDNSVEVALQWEKWRIPFLVEVDLKSTTLNSIHAQMTGALGFDPASLEAAARWCLNNETNYDEGLHWINMAVDPNLGGVKSFNALSTKAGLLTKLNKTAEADTVMKMALENATTIELHQYGRQLQSQKKFTEAMAVFEKNYKKYKGAWPTNVGMMRGYSGLGNYKKALEYAKAAVPQAPDEQNKKNLEQAVKDLSEGKPVN